MRMPATALAFVLTGALLAGVQARAAESVSFNGTWQGKIFFDKETFLTETSTPTSGLEIRIKVADEVVRVFFVNPSGPEESMVGAYHIAPADANAVIYATEVAQGGPWVETNVFVVSQKDKDTWLVQYVRAVNNVGLALSEADSKFAARGAGEFKRVLSD